MLHGGSEMLRTKFGDPNTYNAGDGKNKYDWNRKAFFFDVFEAYRDVIKLRRELNGFRLPDASQINRRLQVSDEGGGLIRGCLLYTSPSPRDRQKSRMPSSA